MRTIIHGRSLYGQPRVERVSIFIHGISPTFSRWKIKKGVTDGERE
jgi:hypothetical protein